MIPLLFLVGLISVVVLVGRSFARIGRVADQDSERQRREGR